MIFKHVLFNRINSITQLIILTEYSFLKELIFFIHFCRLFIDMKAFESFKIQLNS
jgi:hypothetical protein